MKIIVYFKRLPKGILGMCEHNFGVVRWATITVDLKKNTNHAKVFLHELIHAYHPFWSESRVLKCEIKTWRRLTQHQRFLLYKQLFNRKWRV